MKKILVIFISFGLLFTNFTSLRVWGPIGIGELVLLLSTFVAILFYLNDQTKFIRSESLHSILLLLFFLLIITISNLFGMMNYHFVIHDYLAFILSIALTFSILLAENSYRILKEIMRTFYLFASIYILFLIIYIPLVSNVFLGHDLLYWDIRLRGLSSNPNQLALLMLFLLPLSIFFFQTKVYSRVFNLIIFICSLYVSIQTLSDALMIAIAFGGFFFLLHSFFITKKIKKEMKIVICLSIPILLILLRTLFLTQLLSVFDTFDSDGDQASIRLILWKNGIIAFLHSPIIGNGGGGHSGVSGPFGNFESHNSLIDFLSMFGLFGLFVISILFLTILIRNRHTPLFLSLMMSIIVFSMFHNILRQPLVWVFFSIGYLGFLDSSQTNESSRIVRCKVANYERNH